MQKGKSVRLFLFFIQGFAVCYFVNITVYHMLSGKEITKNKVQEKVKRRRIDKEKSKKTKPDSEQRRRQNVRVKERGRGRG